MRRGLGGSATRARGFTRPAAILSSAMRAEHKIAWACTQLDEEWRRKYEEREDQWRHHLHELGEKMLAMTGVLCDAMNIVHDADTERTIKTGLARLSAINRATEAEASPTHS